MNPRCDIDRSRPGERDSRQRRRPPGDQPRQQMGTGKPVVLKPDRHGQIEIDHGRFEDECPHAQVGRGRPDGDRCAHGPAPQNRQENLVLTGPGWQAVEPDPDVAGLASTERRESAAAAAVAAEVKGGHIPPRPAQQGHALGLKGSRGLGKTVEQDRCPSRSFARRGMPEPREPHAVPGQNRDDLRRIDWIAGLVTVVLGASLSRQPWPGRHDERHAPNSTIASSKQAMMPTKNPARPMTTVMM